ncbi:hypothetical protein N0V90_001062 [Kalmusia sp. IMI 367209]|nr:hypothetical protein N0V90_001062 [Kalmusia sp. IMI 367209]
MGISKSPTAVAGLVFIAFVLFATFLRKRALEAKARQDGFAPPTKYRALDPFLALDYVFKIFTDISFTQRNRLRYGKTFIIEPLLGVPTIVTADPENIQKVFGSVDNDFGVFWRREPFEPFTGRGLLTEDGDGWRHPRKLYRPIFAKNNIADLDYYGKMVNDMLEQIPGNGETVDLHPLLLKAFMNNALHFVLGYDAMNPHPGAPLSRDGFMSRWNDGMQGVGLRIATGRLSSLLPTARFKAACSQVQSFVEFHIKQSLENDSKTKKESQILTESLLAQTDDRTLTRNMLVQAVIGAQDTTSVLTSNTLYLLAQHPALWQELRVEVSKLGSDLFTFDALRTNEVIQNMLLESLRLRPIFPALDRVAVRNTTLPTGGGKDGASQVLVPPGTRVQCSFYALHREESVFGPDIETFNPHRWKSIKPSQWEYFPFGGGPRSCMGKEKSLVEAAYVLGKLASRFKTLESRDDRPWTGVMTMTCANKHGCLVAFE